MICSVGVLSFSTFSAFLGASVLITLAPGPDNVFVITKGITSGTKSALFAAWGMVSGVSLHLFFAAIGLSAVVYSSPVVFGVFKYAGAAYLFYLAWMTFRGMRHDLNFQNDATEISLGALYRRGFLMNVLNPKVGIFFLAFLPQFVWVNDPHRLAHLMFLGIVFMAQAWVIFSLIAVFSARLGRALNSGKELQYVLSVFAGLTFVLFGVKLILG